MVLVIDIGNTDIVAAINNNHRWESEFRFPSKNLLEDYSTFDKWLLEIKDKFEQAEGEVSCIVSSVVPPVTNLVTTAVKKQFHIDSLVMGPALYETLELEVIHPNEIGTDLVANAYAGWKRFEQPVIIVDFGTALTFTVVNAAPSILGVSIAPGIYTAMRSLFQQTAQLKEVPLILPASAIGKNTTHAIQAGLLWGYVGLVEKMLSKIKEELAYPCKVIATGGLSKVLEPLSKQFDIVDKQLTLEGLYLISVAHEKHA